MNDLNWGVREVDFEDIVVDISLQIRVELNEDRISDFVDIFEILPPMKLVRVEKQLLLADGFHRYYAAERRRAGRIKAAVIDGTYKEALLVAIRENCKSSLSLTRADKRKAVTQALMFFPERANSWIAEEIGTSMQTVGSVREDLEKDGKIETYEEFQRRDGRTTPRKYSTQPEVSEEEAAEVTDLARLAGAKLDRKTVSTDEDMEGTPEDDALRHLVREGTVQYHSKDRTPEVPVESGVVRTIPKIERSVELILSEQIDLPIGMYNIVFSKQGDVFDVRLHLIEENGSVPTDVGVQGGASLMNLILEVLRG